MYVYTSSALGSREKQFSRIYALREGMPPTATNERNMFYCLSYFAGDVTPRTQQKRREQEDTEFPQLSTEKKGNKYHKGVQQVDWMLRERTQEKIVILIKQQAPRSGGGCRFIPIYAREGIGTAKKEKNECDHVLVIVCRHRYCKERKEGETNVTMSWLYYVAIGSRM